MNAWNWKERLHSPYYSRLTAPSEEFNARVFFSAKFISAPNEKLSEVRVETVRLRRAGIDRLTVKTTSGTTRQVWRQSCESDEEGALDNVWAGNKKEYSIQESVKEELDFFFWDLSSGRGWTARNYVETHWRRQKLRWPWKMIISEWSLIYG